MDLLVFGNLDEDHVDDLSFVWQHVPLGSIFSNPTVTATALAAMKRDQKRPEAVTLSRPFFCVPVVPRRNHGL